MAEEGQEQKRYPGRRRTVRHVIGQLSPEEQQYFERTSAGFDYALERILLGLLGEHQGMTLSQLLEIKPAGFTAEEVKEALRKLSQERQVACLPDWSSRSSDVRLYAVRSEEVPVAEEEARGAE